MSVLNVQIKLQNVRCYDDGPGIGNAEPYLWAVFFKVDGDTAFVNEALGLQGRATVVGTHGYHANLFGRSAGSGDNLPIPDGIGEFRTTLRPIPLRTPLSIFGVTLREIPAVCGCLVLLMEEDNTPDRATEVGYQRLVVDFQNALDALVPSLGATNPSPTPAQITAITQKVRTGVANAVKNDLSFANYLGLIATVGNVDDLIGSLTGIFSAADIESAGAAGLPIAERWKVEGDWGLTGFVKGTSLPPDANEGICRPVTPAVAVYEHQSAERMYVFVPDDNGRLLCFYGTGGSGVWADQGLPPGGAILADAPAAVNAFQASGNYLYAFARGSDGGLYENSWNTFAWAWTSHARPGANQAITTSPGAYVFRKESGPLLSNTVDNVYVGVAAADGHLWIRAWARSNSGSNYAWQWIDHGKPMTSNVASEPAITTYRVNGAQRLYMFVRGADGRLYERFWDGAPNRVDTDVASGFWHWTDHGQPAPGVNVASAPTIQLYPDDPTRSFCVFVVGSDGGLYLRRWNATAGQWQWDALTRPAGFPAMTGRPAVAYFRHDNTPRMYVYLRGADNATHVCFWDTHAWQWRHSEAAMPRPIATPAAAIPFKANGVSKMYSYWVGDNHKLYTYRWDAALGAWSWLPLGSP